MENKARGVHNVIVAGDSYGQGSSREHAALCPMYLGVKAVIAKSFERIHAANLVNFGIIPMVFADAADYDKVQAGDRLTAPGWRDAVAKGAPVIVRNGRTGETFACICQISEKQRAIVAAGGLLNYVSASRDAGDPAYVED